MNLIEGGEEQVEVMTTYDYIACIWRGGVLFLYHWWFFWTLCIAWTGRKDIHVNGFRRMGRRKIARLELIEIEIFYKIANINCNNSVHELRLCFIFYLINYLFAYLGTTSASGISYANHLKPEELYRIALEKNYSSTNYSIFF